MKRLMAAVLMTGVVLVGFTQAGAGKLKIKLIKSGSLRLGFEARAGGFSRWEAGLCGPDHGPCRGARTPFRKRTERSTGIFEIPVTGAIMTLPADHAAAVLVLTKEGTSWATSSRHNGWRRK
jgi:hypothetical protein